MTALLLALVLGAPAEARREVGWLPSVGACSVRVLAADPEGRLVSARTVSGRRTPAVVFRGRAAEVPEGDPPLVFDVFNPRGQRYQVLLGSAYGRGVVLQGRPQSSGQPVQATLAVAASSIAWTSMYGRWHVVPRFEGQDDPCGRAQAFTILP
jgi:hypothetical protein